MSVPVVSLMSAVSSARTFWVDPMSNILKTLHSERKKANTDIFLQALPEHGSDISALRIGRAETLCPANEFAVIDALLSNYRPKSCVGNTIDFDNDTTYEHGYEN